MPQSEWRSAPHLWLAMMLSAGAGLAYYVLLHQAGPFPDEGSYCTIAQGIVQGYLPYADYFNEKPPLHYYLTAAFFALFGGTMNSARIVAALLFALALFVSLSILARHKDGGRMLFWALVLAFAGLTMRAYNNLGESSLALLGVIGLRVALMRRQEMQPRLGFVAGVSQGLSCGFRLTAGFSMLALAFAPWSRKGRAAYLAGAGLVLLVLVGMLAAGGILTPFLDATLWLHWHNPGSAAYFRGLNEDSRIGFLLWSGVMVVATVAAIRQRQYWVVPFLLAAALPFFGRMDAFRLWPSTLMGFSYLFAQAGTMRWPRHRWVTGCMILMLGIWFVRPESGFNRVQEIVAAIKSMTQPQDTIWVAPFLPNVYCLSERRPASRHYFVLPWTLNPTIRHRLVEDLHSHPPRVIVDASNRAYNLEQMLPEVRAMLQAEYELVKQDTDVSIYLIKASGH